MGLDGNNSKGALKMNFDLKLGKAASVLFLALAMAGCGGGNSQTATTPMEPSVPVPVPPTDLEKARTAAKAAADAAMTASTKADTAAGGAEAATMNLATLQTGEMANMYAMEARKYAGMAMTAYMDAKKASGDAAAATDALAATRALVTAETAKMAAEGHANMADEKAMKATEAVMMELMIDGTMKSVGETSVDAAAGASSVSTGAGDDARTVITGLIKDMNPKATGVMITGADYEPATADDLATPEIEPTAAATPYKQAAAARTFIVGKTLDSSDDMARLTLVTHYAGMDMVKVYSAGADEATGTKAGYLTIVDGDADTTDTNNTPLKSVGMYHSAGTADGALTNNDEVAATAKPVELFSYVDPSDSTTKYATLMTTSKTGAVTTYTYTSGADITAAAAAPDGPDDTTALDEAQVTVGIPAPVAYQHIHFGAWAGLGEAAKDGSQKIADLGIGFVQSIRDGMTGADMPNAGTAEYMGNWVAAVRAAHAAGEGGLSLTNGAASVSTDFGKAKITATLTGLAKLEGSIDGSMFSGTKATAESGNSHGLTSGGTFSGTFSGGFYGAKAAEAGGVFDFTSADASSGEFRGAFGGKKQP